MSTEQLINSARLFYWDNNRRLLEKLLALYNEAPHLYHKYVGYREAQCDLAKCNAKLTGEDTDLLERL